MLHGLQGFAAVGLCATSWGACSLGARSARNSRPPEVVFQTLYVVFAEVVPPLHLDECEGFRPRVGATVRGAQRNVDRLPGPEGQLFAATGHHGLARDPVSYTHLTLPTIYPV